MIREKHRCPRCGGDGAIEANDCGPDVQRPDCGGEGAERGSGGP